MDEFPEERCWMILTGKGAAMRVRCPADKLEMHPWQPSAEVQQVLEYIQKAGQALSKLSSIDEAEETVLWEMFDELNAAIEEASRQERSGSDLGKLTVE
jgi:hypothetical protein